jgi:hypothetical protein
MTVQKLDGDGPTDPSHQSNRNAEYCTGAGASPHHQNLAPLQQQDNQPHQRSAVPPLPVATAGALNTQTRLSDLSPCQETSQLVPRNENRRIRKRKRSQVQLEEDPPSTATNGLDTDTAVDRASDSDVLIT